MFNPNGLTKPLNRDVGDIDREVHAHDRCLTRIKVEDSRHFVEDLGAGHLSNSNQFDFVVADLVPSAIQIQSLAETVLAKIANKLIMVSGVERPLIQSPQLAVEPLKFRSEVCVSWDSQIQLIYAHWIPRFAYGVLELQAIRHSLQTKTI